MGKYTFNIIHKNNLFKIDDSFNEWISAKDSFEAKQVIEAAYPDNKGYSCMLIKVDV